MYKWLFHLVENLIEKLKLIQKLQKQKLKFYTDEIMSYSN